MKDGGPVFPTERPEHISLLPGGEEQYVQATYHGMSLRDYFAAQALVGMLANPALLEALTAKEIAVKGAAEVVSTYAFKYADAMVAERAKGDAR